MEKMRKLEGFLWQKPLESVVSLREIDGVYI
jgi:hypothetical protein